MGAKPGQSRKSGRQRLALVLFGALFVVLFAGYAIAQGLGSPSVPSGAVAIVTHVPDEVGTVTESDFKRALLQQATQAKIKGTPKPGDEKYEELKAAAMREILEGIWIQGEAEELGIAVTPKQIATEAAQIKKTNFKTPAEYKEFLKTSHFTKADFLDRVELQLFVTQIQEKLANEAPPASSEQISASYDSNKDTQYTTPASRDVRVIVNKDKAKAEAAKSELEKDDSPESWKKVAQKYSEDPSTKAKGGLQPGLTEELLASQEELKSAIFGNPTGVVVGPVVTAGKSFVIEVDKLNPEKVKSLDEVKAEIESQLSQQLAQEAVSDFVVGYQGKWSSRTFCADGYVIEQCSNYVGSGHPSGAPEACYEADPKGGAPEECPASVIQVKPAPPGTNTLLKRQGTPEAITAHPPQAPHPAGPDEAAAEGLPEGVPGATTAPPPSGE